jgi:hypothetical protein
MGRPGSVRLFEEEKNGKYQGGKNETAKGYI